MAVQSSGGALGFLDGLGGALIKISGAAVQTAANVAAAKDTLKGPKSGDQNAAEPVSRVQAAVSSIPVVWIVAGLAVLVGGFLLLRRKG